MRFYRIVIAALLVCLAPLVVRSAEPFTKLPQKRVIAVADRDGRNLKIIAEEPAAGLTINGSPRWSPDGKTIAFDSVTVDHDWSFNRIFTVRVDQETPGTAVDLGYGTAPDWSADGSQIAFCMNSGNPHDFEYGCWVMDNEGKGREWLAGGFFPRISPDGRKLAYQLSPSIGVLDLRTGKTSSGAVPDRTEGRFEWSPDSKHFLYVTSSSRDQFDLLVRYMPEKHQAITLCPAKGVDLRDTKIGLLCCSRDGKSIAFRMRASKHPPGIYTIDAQQPGMPKLVLKDTPNRQYREPHYSPDGKRLAFAIIFLGE